MDVCWKQLMSFNQRHGYMQVSHVWFLISSITHDHLYAPQIGWNVVPKSGLMYLSFHDKVFELTKGPTLYGKSFISGSFTILELDAK